MDEAARQKWNRAAATYDRFSAQAAERRWADYKRALFAHMSGRILFLAVGTGLDIALFPPGQNIVGIDISEKMLERAQPRAALYDGALELRQMDVHELDFPPAHFDQVYTSCTFCSVPRPVEALKRLRRALRPDGELRMFEHTGSRWFPFRPLLHAMNPLTRRLGPEVNRPTVENVRAAGFRVRRVVNHYLDIVKSIEAGAGW